MYSLRKGIYKSISSGLVYLVAFALVAMIEKILQDNIWGVNTLTVGTILMGLKNYIKVAHFRS